MPSASDQAKFQIVGGVYREYCLQPAWTEVFGSGGRAASAASALRARPHLSCYGDEAVREVLRARAALEDFSVEVTDITQSVRFDYDHGLATPRILGLAPRLPALRVAGPSVLRFGMLEGDAIVSAEQAVYDPQDAESPRLFGENGSAARRLALVLNRHEAQLLVGSDDSASDLARAILSKSGAEVIVMKDGARGALVLEHGRVADVPAYQSASVWKIGSGDNFAAHFAVRWMLEGKSAAESADLASRATAYYCETRGFPDDELLATYVPRPVQPSPRYIAGYKPRVYLAGPFFSLAQVWLVDQARTDLRAAGLRVFSPYHDVGIGVAQEVVAADIEGINESDIVFAVLDGMDPGTVFEIGYARAMGKPVVVYSEMPSGENHKMLQGTDCTIVADYVTAVYQTAWTACTL